jgi:hypothetical protein
VTVHRPHWYAPDPEELARCVHDHGGVDYVGMLGGLMLRLEQLLDAGDRAHEPDLEFQRLFQAAELVAAEALEAGLVSGDLWAGAGGTLIAYTWAEMVGFPLAVAGRRRAVSSSWPRRVP